jgi:hypothetical protein
MLYVTVNEGGRYLQKWDIYFIHTYINCEETIAFGNANFEQVGRMRVCETYFIRVNVCILCELLIKNVRSEWRTSSCAVLWCPVCRPIFYGHFRRSCKFLEEKEIGQKNERHGLLITLGRRKIIYFLFKVPTSEMSWLMLFSEIIPIRSDNLRNLVITSCRQNAELLDIEGRGTYKLRLGFKE